MINSIFALFHDIFFNINFSQFFEWIFTIPNSNDQHLPIISSYNMKKKKYHSFPFPRLLILKQRLSKICRWNKKKEKSWDGNAILQFVASVSIVHYTKESLFPFYSILRIRETLMIMQGFRLRFHRVADLITISFQKYR